MASNGQNGSFFSPLPPPVSMPHPYKQPFLTHVVTSVVFTSVFPNNKIIALSIRASTIE